MSPVIRKTQEPLHSTWYLTAMERLVGVVQELSQAHHIDEITAIVREAARALTGADGATFVLRDEDQCYYVEENAIAPLWKGRRFPMSACISGWVMLNAREAVIENIYADPRVPGDVYRPTFVKSLAMVPIRRRAPIGAIGNYWSSHRMPTQEEVAVLQALADTTSVALRNADLYGQLESQVKVLQEQRERIEEQRDTLEVFTRALAHDLREPARTMKSFSQFLLDKKGDPEEVNSYVQFIQDGADRMTMLIDSVIHFMQLDDPARMTPETCAMNCVLQSVKGNLAQLIRDRGAVIDCGTLPVVQANRSHMMQVLQNLIANALRHNEAGITVRVQAEEQADTWLFSVRDNGRGIASEHAHRIFQPFKRLSNKNECAGLGLSICDRIVSRYGGSIWCESQTGEGATICFTLPRAAEAEPEPAQRSDAPSSPGDGANRSLACLLLVDDRPDDLTLSRMMLSEDGIQCHVRTAQNGAECLDILAREPVDLMLLDINMPGMDGFEVPERMLQGDETMKRITVIMCSGANYEKDKERSRALGTAGYLVKPLNLEELWSLLERIPTLHLEQDSGSRKLLRVENQTH